MKPQDFPQSNRTLTRPPALTDLECGSLQVWSDNRQCISCWKPSFRERISILIHGKVWLSVHTGVTQPPVWIDGQKQIFIIPPFKARVKTFISRITKLYSKAHEKQSN